MGFIHETGDNYFGIETHRESTVILFGGDHEEQGLYIYALPNTSGGIELTHERLRDLVDLMKHPAIVSLLADLPEDALKD